MAFQVEGKSALVTGGGSGICLEFTKTLLENGCNVLIADLRLLPEAEEVVQRKGAKARALFKQTDVTDWTQLQSAFDEALKEFGKLDIVCPGAGVYEPTWSHFWVLKDTVDTVEKSTYKSLDINVTHPLRATQLAIDSFKRQKLNHGSVVLVSSIAAQSANLSAPIYTASKAAISAFTRSLSYLEKTMNIRVVAVAPAIVKTPLLAKGSLVNAIDHEKDALVMPDDIAKSMLDLIQNPDYVGGTVLEVGVEYVRKVALWNDPGPQGKGCHASNMASVYGDTIQLINTEYGQ